MHTPSPVCKPISDLQNHQLGYTHAHLWFFNSKLSASDPISNSYPTQHAHYLPHALHRLLALPLFWVMDSVRVRVKVSESIRVSVRLGLVSGSELSASGFRLGQGQCGHTHAHLRFLIQNCLHPTRIPIHTHSTTHTLSPHCLPRPLHRPPASPRSSRLRRRRASAAPARF